MKDNNKVKSLFEDFDYRYAMKYIYSGNEEKLLLKCIKSSITEAQTYQLENPLLYYTNLADDLLDP